MRNKNYMQLNTDKLVMLSVIGEIASPVTPHGIYVINTEGIPEVVPAVGGITYNLRIGDRCVGLKADHVEPAVSIKSLKNNTGYGNHSLTLFSCIGNEAKVVTGEGKGEKGVVTGKHGGIEHVHVDFPPEVMEKLVIGDKIQIKSFGLGLEINKFPHIKVMNVDPGLFTRLKIKLSGKKLEIPVTHLIPAYIMGGGFGSTQAYTGDQDIQIFDRETREKYNLDTLRFGDIVAVMDADHTYGRMYKKGAVSIGVVIHGDCLGAGHGPGVTTILTSAKGSIVPVIDKDVNLVNYVNNLTLSH